MFTGIITNLGLVTELKSNSKKDLLIKISSAKNQIDRKLQIGCSIACNGICLTLIEKKIIKENVILSFQASEETIAKTNLKNWQIGQIINLEFSMRLGDELGGHMVLGHVDGTAKISKIIKIKDSYQFIFAAKKDLLKFIAPKGSITINGVSLTVNEAATSYFSVNLIPHTLNHTSFKNAKINDLVNLEIDVIARYLKQLSK